MANKNRVEWMVWPTHMGDEVEKYALQEKKFKDPVTAMKELAMSDEPDGLYSIDTFDTEDEDPFVAGFTLEKKASQLDLRLDYNWRGRNDE